MICNQCGKDNTEDAVFCKYCGKRIDGMTVCPSCQKLIEDDSEFCIYCGHSLKNETLPNTEIAIKQVDKQKVVNYAVYAVTALLALLSIVFIFFIGIRQVHISSSGEVEYFDFDIFYYFKNAYKDYEQTLEFYNKWDNLSDVTAICKASLLLPTILGTVISVVALSGVCVF
ncbi:MAG: zinc ribbon domain-containing protein, partial [Clostridia bacterium]|nr:zinc ribbon domain-containing protein [Clostridia bacterium]